MVYDARSAGRVGLWSCLATLLAYPTVVAAADPVVIETPANGALVPTKFSITVSYGLIDYCEDTCEEVPTEEVYVRANEMLVGFVEVERGSSEVTLEVVLPLGQYELIAMTEWAEIAGALSEPVYITVAESTTSGAPDSPTSGGSDSTGSGTTTSETSAASTTSNDASEKHDGCACDADPGVAHRLLPYAAVIFFRPRRGRASATNDTVNAVDTAMARQRVVAPHGGGSLPLI